MSRAYERWVRACKARDAAEMAEIQASLFRRKKDTGLSTAPLRRATGWGNTSESRYNPAPKSWERAQRVQSSNDRRRQRGMSSRSKKKRPKGVDQMMSTPVRVTSRDYKPRDKQERGWVEGHKEGQRRVKKYERRKTLRVRD